MLPYSKDLVQTLPVHGLIEFSLVRTQASKRMSCHVPVMLAELRQCSNDCLDGLASTGRAHEFSLVCMAPDGTCRSLGGHLHRIARPSCASRHVSRQKKSHCTCFNTFRVLCPGGLTLPLLTPTIQCSQESRLLKRSSRYTVIVEHV